jgi:outer membrane receptor protein involved in Fe transport
MDRAWDWNAYYQHGKTKADELLHSTFNFARMNAATDAVFHPDSGEIVCRTSIANPGNGCVPINRIGIGGVSQQALDYIMGPSQPYRSQEFTQDVIAFNMSTNDLFQNWAGPVSFATGFEAREDAITGDVDPIHNAGWLYGNYRVTDGSSRVAEAYVESVFPLSDNMDINAAYRVTNYEYSGTANTWKVGFSWQPIEDVRLRITRSHDIRAPNLSEMFDAGRARTNTVNLFPSMQAAQFLENTTGNIALIPEEADSLGIGMVVIRPVSASRLLCREIMIMRSTR